jgi:hypothetical protein
MCLIPTWAPSSSEATLASSKVFGLQEIEGNETLCDQVMRPLMTSTLPQKRPYSPFMGCRTSMLDCVHYIWDRLLPEQHNSFLTRFMSIEACFKMLCSTLHRRDVIVFLESSSSVSIPAKPEWEPVVASLTDLKKIVAPSLLYSFPAVENCSWS